MFWRKLAQKIVSQVLASYHTVAALVLQSTQCTRGYHITRTARVVRRKTDTRMHAPMSFLKNKLFEGTTHQHAIDRLPAGKATCERDAQRQSRIRWWSTGMIVPAGKGRGGEGLYRASMPANGIITTHASCPGNEKKNELPRSGKHEQHRPLLWAPGTNEHRLPRKCRGHSSGSRLTAHSNERQHLRASLEHVGAVSPFFCKVISRASVGLFSYVPPYVPYECPREIR